MKHIQRANFVAMLWQNAGKVHPNVSNPLEFGWKVGENGTFMPVWFEGRATPDFSHDELEGEEETEPSEELESGSEWSGDSGNSDSDEYEDVGFIFLKRQVILCSIGLNFD